MSMFANYLRLVVICLFGICCMPVMVQLQQNRVRHHYSYKEQQQKQGNIIEAVLHVLFS